MMAEDWRYDEGTAANSSSSGVMGTGYEEDEEEKGNHHGHWTEADMLARK